MCSASRPSRRSKKGPDRANPDIVEQKLEKRPVFWFYGTGAIAYGVKNNAFSYLLLIYANQVLGLPGYLASIALAVALVWDAATDLFVGHWSDKTSSRHGRRHPFMYAALVVLPAAFYGLFNPYIELTGANTFTYVLVMAILIRTGTTLFEVPSTSLLPELESQYDRRNKWLALRHAFGWYGGNLLHTVNFLFWVGAYGFTVQTGYSIYAAVGAALILLAITVSSLGTRREAAALPRPAEPLRIRAIAHEIRQVFQSVRNPNFAALFFYGLVAAIGAGLAEALFLYNAYYFFGFSGVQIAAVGICVMVSPVTAYWVAPRLGARLGKKGGAITGILLTVSIYPVPFVLLLLGWWPAIGSWPSLFAFAAITVIQVVCLMSGGVLLDSMMADVVEDSEVATSRRSEGLFYAARGFVAKGISAGGVLGAGTIVSLVGLDGIDSVDLMTRELRVNLASMFLPLFCGLNLLALLIVSRYRITRDGHSANLAALARRKGAAEPGADSGTAAGRGRDSEPGGETGRIVR
ncbi:MAG: MFS transporter [Gammaproteobacteria bacterium]|nr:MFS transporter [Gammaproteobacteria bacterium]